MADAEQEVGGGFDGGDDFRAPLSEVGNAAPVNLGLARYEPGGSVLDNK